MCKKISTGIISHPSFDIFIAVTINSIHLFSFAHGPIQMYFNFSFDSMPQFQTKSISLSSLSKIISPENSLLSGQSNDPASNKSNSIDSTPDQKAASIKNFPINIKDRANLSLSDDYQNFENNHIQFCPDQQSTNVKKKMKTITCGAFSPNGNKLVICSRGVIIFPFDTGKKVIFPSFWRSFNTTVKCVAWLNSDSTIIVVLEDDRILIVDCLRDYNIPVHIETGPIGSIIDIRVDHRNNIFVYITESGYAVVCSFQPSIELKQILTLSERPICIQNLYEFFVIGTKNGVECFKLSEQGIDTVFNSKAIVGLSLSSKVVLMIDEENSILLWRN